jgi:FeS assembly SUF system protein
MMGMEEKLPGDSAEIQQEAEVLSETDATLQETKPDRDALVPGSTLTHGELDLMTDNIVRALKTVYDPEIPVDVYELGLIYRVDIDDDHKVDIDMTLTAPGCPVAGEMPIWVRDAVSLVAGVSDVNVNMVFDPPWDMSRMSDEARVALNMF